jgi:hypothetical protein
VSAVLDTAVKLLGLIDRARLLDVLNAADLLREALAAAREQEREAERRRRRVTLWPVELVGGAICNAGRDCGRPVTHRAVYAGAGKAAAVRYACDTHAARLRTRGAVDAAAATVGDVAAALVTL